MTLRDKIAGRMIGPLRFVGRSGTTALGVGGAILLLLVSGSVLLAIRNGDALDVARRTQRTRSAAAAMQANLLLAESGQRGYLLTGRNAYLQPYREAVETFGRALSTLEESTALEPAVVTLLKDIRSVAADKFAEMDETIRLNMTGDKAGALALVQSDRGATDTVRLRDLTGRLIEQQQMRLTGEFEGVQLGTEILEAANLGGLICMLGLAVIVGGGLGRAVSAVELARTALNAANGKLARNNETLEAEVARRTADLTEANEEIQRFAYIVSHDLRAPLVNIMGFTGELQTAAETISRNISRLEELPDEAVPRSMKAELHEAVNDEMTEAIRFIRASTDKMDRLIKAILQLAREGRRVLTAEPVSMRVAMTAIVETLAHQLSEAKAEVSIDEMPDLVADRVAVEQVFSNLIENAVKYLKPGRPGRIAISGRASGRTGAETMAVYDVRDNGRGIAARDLERVFELFRRAGDQTVPGEGIGLAHVRALVRRMGGKIDCESILGEGSNFRVRLPLKAADAGVVR